MNIKCIDKVGKHTYYKYVLWNGSQIIGELFSNIQSVLSFVKQMADDGDIFSLEDYSDINKNLYKIESILGKPNTNGVLVLNYDMRSRVIGNIDSIDKIIKEYGYSIKENIA